MNCAACDKPLVPTPGGRLYYLHTAEAGFEPVCHGTTCDMQRALDLGSQSWCATKFLPSDMLDEIPGQLPLIPVEDEAENDQ